jgi:hypothetical protein
MSIKSLEDQESAIVGEFKPFKTFKSFKTSAEQNGSNLFQSFQYSQYSECFKRLTIHSNTFVKRLATAQSLGNKKQRSRRDQSNHEHNDG